jgi:hypothetical protein
MRLFPEFSKKTALKAVILIVVINVLLFFGLHFWFKNSDEWYEIQKLVISSSAVTSYVGEVKQVTLSLFWLTYEFSGHRAEANFDIVVVGETNTESFNVIAKRKHWKWSIVNVSKN